MRQQAPDLVPDRMVGIQTVGTPVLPGTCDAAGNGTVPGSFYNCPAGLGIVTHTIGSPRQIQMSLHFDF